MKIDTGVFKRKGVSTLSERAFYGATGMMLMWGFAVTVLMSYMFKSYQPGLVEILLLGLAVPIIGIIISVKSDNWFISFIGYNMICFPFGVILAPVLNSYSPAVIQNVFTLTLLIAAAMTLSAFMFPKFYESIGGALLVSLTGFVLVSIISLFIPALNAPWLHYVGVLIFSLYIGYDMWRATQVLRNLDSAVDIAVSLYLDILNLFLQLLSLSGSDD